jgi:hypothetical protein
MSDTVEYILRLKDEMSGTLKSVTAQTNVLNETIKGVGEALVAYFAFDKIREFANESVKAFEEQEQAIAQVRQGLITMRGASGQTLESLKEWSENKMNESLYDDDEILRKVSSTLLTFGNISGDTFMQAQQAALDLATRMGGDLQGASVQLGKALNDPITGLTALRRVGVSFSEDQIKVIKSLTETGHVAQAQSVILQELQQEFGGSAKAAYDALGPWEKIQKMIKPIMEDVGQLIVDIQKKLSPIITAVVQKFSVLVDYFKGSGGDSVVTFFKPIIDVIKSIYVDMLPIIENFKQSVSQWWPQLKQLMFGIRDVVVILLQYGGQLAKWAWNFASGIIDVFHTIYVLLEKLKVIYVIVGAFRVLWDVAKAVGNMFVWVYDHAIAPIVDKIAQLYGYIKQLLGITGTQTNSALDIKMPKRPPNALDRQGAPGGLVPGGSSGTVDTGKVTGSRNTTINITIQKMVDGGINISTTTLKESASQMQDAIAKALLNAVNDAQIIANQ